MLCPVPPPPGSACLCWGLDGPDPGPGVMTMRRTLKQDIPQLLTQRRGKNQWALYSVGTVESILSPKNPAPVPSVSILQHSQTSQPTLCGHSWTRITQSMCPALDNTQSQAPV